MRRRVVCSAYPDRQLCRQPAAGHAFIAMLPVLNSPLIPRQAARSPVTVQLSEYAQIKPETSLIYF